MKNRINLFSGYGVIGICLMVLMGFSGCQQSTKPAPAPEAKYIASPRAVKMKLPFSEAVRVGNMLYLSGQIGIDYETGQLAAGGIQPETRKTLENMKATLERNGSSLDHVLKCTVMLADIAEWPAMNEVYVTFFKKHFPARSAFAGSGLAKGARVEIECIATVK